jgi:hypothetical protein
MKERMALAPMREDLQAWIERLGLPDLRAAVGAPVKAVDPAARERLRQLGYAE